MKGFVALLLLLSLLIFPVAREESTSGSTGAPAQSSSPAAEESATPGSSSEETAAPGSTSSENPVTPSGTITSAEAYVQALVDAVETKLTLEISTLDLSSQRGLDDFKRLFDIPHEDAVREAAIAMNPIGAVAFFLGVFKVETPADAVRLAEACEENADLHKLVCAPYTLAEGEAAGNYVLYVMDRDRDRADALIDAFLALAKSAS